MDQIATTVYLVIYAIALLVLISLGLAVIFGMMKVINLAHGEFMMLGAYVCVLAGNAGAPLWAAAAASAVLVGAFGVVVERLIIRFLYGRIIDTLLATWGLSLFLVGGVTTVFGPQGRSLSTSFGNVSLGGVNLSTYNLLLIGVTAALAILTWALASFTRFGLIVRGTMQDPVVASALGVDRGLIYMATFGYGAALAGFAGALLVPITGASPTMGLLFVAKAFITVIVGGHLPLSGTLAASGLFGAIDGVVSVPMEFRARRGQRPRRSGDFPADASIRHYWANSERPLMDREFAADSATPPRWWWWLLIVALVIVLISMPHFTDVSLQLDLSIIFVLALLALSMSFLWGYVGILSFGQTIFFGLGGYSYAILALNAGTTLWPFAAAIFLPMIFAAVLGYFVIYGRISDIYLSVISLVVTLIFEKSIRSTSGPEYVIGAVRLNGQNGIPGVPALQLPWDSSMQLSIDGVFYLAGGTTLLVYVCLRLLLLTSFGRIIVGIRESETRMELLGYDSRIYKLVAFVLAAGIAALSGALYAVWGNFVAPEMFNLNQAAQVVIWVIVGGRSTLIGPVVATGLVQYFSNWLGTVSIGQVTLVLGLVLLVFVLAFPRGLLPTIAAVLSKAVSRSGKQRS